MTEHEIPQHYAVLVRHAKRDECWDKPEDQHQMEGWREDKGRWLRSDTRVGRAALRPAVSDPKSDFKMGDGFALTYALAGRLCDQLLIDNIAVRKIIYGEHLVAKQTASVYKEVINAREVNKRVLGDKDAFEVEMCESRVLTPGGYSDEAVDQIKIGLKCQPVNNRNRGRPTSAAYVLVGHQPDLTFIARRWLGRALPLQVLPIEGSEVACLWFGGEPRLLWLITNKKDDLLTDLKDKIKSKYDVAKFFLGAFVVNTGLILNAGVWGNIRASSQSSWIDKVLIIVAISAALVSLMFTAATLFSYDGLLMPSRLWSEWSEPTNKLPQSLRKPPKWSIKRPPSQVHMVLFYEMVHIWTAFFMPAIVAAFAAVGLLVVALARRGIGVLVKDSLEPPGFWAISLAISLVLFAFFLPWVFYQRRKPRLGSED
jgi:hypothetical protein